MNTCLRNSSDVCFATGFVRTSTTVLDEPARIEKLCLTQPRPYELQTGDVDDLILHRNRHRQRRVAGDCLLYTSDAADE